MHQSQHDPGHQHPDNSEMSSHPPAAYAQKRNRAQVDVGYSEEVETGDRDTGSVPICLQIQKGCASLLVLRTRSENYKDFGSLQRSENSCASGIVIIKPRRTFKYIQPWGA